MVVLIFILPEEFKAEGFDGIQVEKITLRTTDAATRFRVLVDRSWLGMT